MANQQFGCGGLRRDLAGTAGRSPSACPFLKTAPSPNAESPPASCSLLTVCLVNSLTGKFVLDAVHLTHSIATARRASIPENTESPQLRVDQFRQLLSERFLPLPLKMSIPSLRGTSFALRGASRPMSASAAMRGIARRANSSIALEGQQKVRSSASRAAVPKSPWNANNLPSCFLPISRRPILPYLILLKRYVSATAQWPAVAPNICIGENSPEALHQPHPVRELHFPGRPRRAWKCYAE